MEQEERSTAPETSTDALSDAIQRIMANPDLISTVAAALGKSPPLPSPPPPKEESAKSLPESEAIATLLPLLSGLTGGTAPEDDRSRLLCALKPFVSQGRRDTIDTLLRFSRLTPILKQLNSSKKGEGHVRTSASPSASNP